MDVHAQLAMVFHLDRCLGCRRCVAACKRSRAEAHGAAHPAFTQVEERPGPGIPPGWETPRRPRGWDFSGRKPRLRSGGPLRAFGDLFFAAGLSELDGRPEPCVEDASALLGADASDDRPTTRPRSIITGTRPSISRADAGGPRSREIDDPNLAGPENERLASPDPAGPLALFQLPRLCNHCLRPACVAACPSGAFCKRAADGLVLQRADRCRGWRRCAAACPYAEILVGWNRARGLKCDLCAARLEQGEAPACFSACPGNSRFLGIVLVDGQRAAELDKVPVERLVEATRAVILDPTDPAVKRAALACGLDEAMLEAARRSPIFPFVKWGLALPLHPELRTLPMAFYVPPLLPPAPGDPSREVRTNPLFEPLARPRLSPAYLARLFAAGNPAPVREALRKVVATRALARLTKAGDLDPGEVDAALAEADLTAAQAETIHRLTVGARLDERVVLPTRGVPGREGARR